MLLRSVDNSTIYQQLPETRTALASWNGRQLPGDDAFAAMESDLVASGVQRKTALLGKFLDYEVPGFRKLIVTTGNRLSSAAGASARERLGGIDRKWLDTDTWSALKRAARPYTLRNVLAAVDLRMTVAGEVTRALPGRDIHLPILARTLGVAALVCLCTLVLGFPVALVIASVQQRLSNVLLMLVLLPFWTSVLVRTTAWIVLLQTQGVVNSGLSMLGLANEPLPLMFSRIGVIIVMTHVLLPFMVLPICNSMKTVSINYVRAGLSLGASPAYTLWKVYLPLVKPGIINGCVLVFISAIGYYVTPALVGGPADQLFSYLIAFHTTNSLNWGMAAALSLLLLTSMGGLYLLIRLIVGPIDLMMEARR
ncbi:ABC transporter permease [Mesorhizobium loti]|nr:ABC transporter permease [Mesorhizobium loti]